MEKIEFKTLTHTEIETLQVDQALRLIGEYTIHQITIRNEIFERTLALGKVRAELDALKNDKSTIIEMTRALKTIADNG